MFLLTVLFQFISKEDIITVQYGSSCQSEDTRERFQRIVFQCQHFSNEKFILHLSDVANSLQWINLKRDNMKLRSNVLKLKVNDLKSIVLKAKLKDLKSIDLKSKLKLRLTVSKSELNDVKSIDLKLKLKPTGELKSKSTDVSESNS